MSPFNIDALKREDGTYRPATYSLIRGARKCGHTAHLQTERGTLAIRPFKRKEIFGEGEFEREVESQMWRVDFYHTGHELPLDDKHDFAEFDLPTQTDLIRWAFIRLNGSLSPVSYGPNDSYDVEANQGVREGTVLAIIDDEMMVEYEMPGTTTQWRSGGRLMGNTTSALRIVRMIGDQEVGHKTCSYNAVPKKWLQAIRDAEMTDWIGMGQRSHKRIPFPIA